MEKRPALGFNKVALVFAFLIGLAAFTALVSSSQAATVPQNCVNGQASPCAEDQDLMGPTNLNNACTQCHSITIVGGNRNGTDRAIVGSNGLSRHMIDPKPMSAAGHPYCLGLNPCPGWGPIVQNMINKGSTADLTVTAGYLDANYCIDCTGVIISSPAVVGVTDTSATITWTTSLNAMGDGPADSVVFYSDSVDKSTTPYTLINPLQADDTTLTGSHSVKLTGLKAATRYYFQYQSTGTAPNDKTVKYNFDAPSFKTLKSTGGGGTTTSTFAYVANVGSNSISVVDVDKAILQTTIFLTESLDGIVASPDGKTVYVTTHNSNISGPYLSAIDTATNTIKSKTLITDPNGGSSKQLSLAISSDGQYLFGMHWSTNLLTISTTDLSVVKSSVLPCNCLELAVSGDGARIYVLRGGNSSSMFMIDAASAINPAVGTVVTPVTLPATAGQAVAAGPDGRGWIAGANQSTDSMVQPDGTATLVTGMLGGPGIVVSKLGDFVYGTISTSADNAQITSVDTSNMKVSKSDVGTFASHTVWGIAVTDDGAKLLVSGRCVVVPCAELLYIVDTFSLEALGSVEVGTLPNKIALATVTTGTPAGPPPTLVYSANGSANNVSVIDPATDAITATVPVGTTPQAVAPSPDGKLVYAVNSDSTVSVIDRSTQTVTATITLPDATTGPVAAIVSPGNNLLYVANHDALKIYVIDTATKTITATIPVGGGSLGPLDLAISPDGVTLYASIDLRPAQALSLGLGYIAVIQTAGNSVVGQITLPTHPAGITRTTGTRLAMNPLGGYLYATVDPYLVVIDTVSNGVITTSKLLNPYGLACNWMRIAVSPDGLVVAPSCYNILYTYDTGTLQKIASSSSTGAGSVNQSNIPGTIGSIAYNDDGSKAYVGLDGTTSANVYAINMTTNLTLELPVATIPLPARANLLASSPAVRSVTGGTPVSLTAPDLTMTAVSATSPVNLSSSATTNISITDTVTNIGGYKAGNFVVNYYFSPTNTFNSATAVFIGFRSITGPLNPAATNTGTKSLKVPVTKIAAGTYYLIAFADGDQAIAEGNEANNKMPTAGTIQVIVADLVETAVSSPAIGTTLLPGATISITDTVLNQGTGATGAVNILYTLVPTSGTGMSNSLGARSITSLAAGASSTATVSKTIPTAAYGGTFYLQAWADSGNTVPESNDSNNKLINTGGIITIPVDLTMTAFTTTATTVTRGGTVSISYTIKNQGNAATGAFQLGVYLSQDNVIVTSDKFLKNVSVSSLAAGASFSGTATVTIPTSTTVGTYYLGAYADYLNAVSETNETNNSRATSGTIQVN